MSTGRYKNIKFNYIVNLLDGSFFGFALGFASFTTIIPLFVSSMTQSAILIGLIPAIHSVGWQLPQLLTARHVSKLKNYKRSVLFYTIQERLPFLGLAIVAWNLPTLKNGSALILTFLLLIWQGLGAGLTANPWQNFIVRIIPGDIRGTFLGLQTGASNLLGSVGAILAGVLLDRFDSPLDFTLCFIFASICLVCSWIFLSQTREPGPSRDQEYLNRHDFWKQVKTILKNDKNFCWLIITRMLSQFAMMSSAFYTVYAVRFHHMSELEAGFLTSVLLLTQVLANPILGWFSDHFNRKIVLEAGAMAACLSSLLAWLSSQVGWFYVVIIFYGIMYTSYWTIGMALTMEFGSDQERPTYVGLANTLIVPSTILAPLVGGFLADSAGYHATFICSAVAALITALAYHFFVKDPDSTLKAEFHNPKLVSAELNSDHK